MNDERFGEYVRELAREIDPVPRTPREAMWLRIQERRGVGREAQPADVIALKPRSPRGGWVQWGAALAAMLLVGIGLGRLSVLRQTEPSPTQVSAPAVESEPSPELVSPYRLATTQHLRRMENLLTTIVIEANSRPVEEMATWARELRTETRLLLASPAAADPVTRRLLDDVELLLSQIAAIPPDRVEEEVELIRERINQGDMLLRVRAATATRMVVGT